MLLTAPLHVTALHLCAANRVHRKNGGTAPAQCSTAIFWSGFLFFTGTRTSRAPTSASNNLNFPNSAKLQMKKEKQKPFENRQHKQRECLPPPIYLFSLCCGRRRPLPLPASSTRSTTANAPSRARHLPPARSQPTHTPISLSQAVR